MRKLSWMRYLSVVLVLTPLMPVSSIKAIPAFPVYLASAKSAYDQYMRQGYSATKQKKYLTALNYFQQALQQRPGDRYAKAAIRNMKAYNRRDRFPIAGIGRPTRTVTGGTRGGCKALPQGTPTLTALVPEEGSQLTVAAYPSFFFYIPAIEAKALELILSSKDGEYIATFKTTGNERGIVSVSLPANSMPPLEIGKTYHWSFAMICDRSDRSADRIVEGSIERIELDPNLNTVLETVPPQERATLYFTAGAWQDTLATMAQLRRTHPNNVAVKTDWEALLQSVGLEKFAQEPLVECCTVQK